MADLTALKARLNRIAAAGANLPAPLTAEQGLELIARCEAAEEMMRRLSLTVENKDAELQDVAARWGNAQSRLAALEAAEALAVRVLENEPDAQGHFVHHPVCNGDRRKEPGTPGVSCSCRVVSRERQYALESRLAALEAAGRRVVAEVNAIPSPDELALGIDNTGDMFSATKDAAIAALVPFAQLLSPSERSET